MNADDSSAKLLREVRTLKDRVRELATAVAARSEAEEDLPRVVALDRELAATVQGRTLQETLSRCADALVRGLDAALARIWILNERENVLELQASAGLYTHIHGPHGRIRIGDLKIGMIAEERRPHLTNAVIGDPRVSNQEWARRERLVAFAGYPLLVEDRLVGVIAIFARRPLSELVLQAMNSVALRIAYAIDRMRAEEALRRSEERLRALIEHSADAIALLDTAGTFLYAGPSTVRVLGYEPDALLSTSGFALVHPEDQGAARNALADLVAGRATTRTVELRLRHKNGRWLWFECVGTNCLENPHVGAVVVNYRDITERKRADEELRRKQKLESLGILAGGVAHDFNNLLTGILGNASLLLSKASPAHSFRPNLEQILESSERAADLVRQLLAYAGKGRFVLERIDLSRVVSEIIGLIQTSIPKLVDLQLEFGRELPSIEADTGQMQQMVTNLVINAAEAIPEGSPGTVIVSTDVQEVQEDYIAEHLAREEIIPGQYVTLEVRDTGTGMDTATVARIFDPFFTTKFQGRGLGLPAVLGIVRRHKGALHVDSTPGKGTSVRILLPASERESATVERHSGLRQRLT